MKNVGIWLDKRQAIIVTLLGNEEVVQYLDSSIEEYHIGGGAGTKAKGGPQDVVQDSRYLEREKHQFKNYFEALLALLTTANCIGIFGPAETAPRLYKYIQETHKEMAKRVRGVLKTDRMTENQICALTRTFFANPSA